MMKEDFPISLPKKGAQLLLQGARIHWQPPSLFFLDALLKGFTLTVISIQISGFLVAQQVMIRVFSGSCLSLDDVDRIRTRLVQRPHVLGAGADYFDEEGNPQAPPSSAHRIDKVFSGSALDLNTFNPDEDDTMAQADETETPKQYRLGSSESSSQIQNSPQRQKRSPKIATILDHLSSQRDEERDRVSKAKTTVLVVGGGGYIGSHIVDMLLHEGYTVRCTIPQYLNRQLVQDLLALQPQANTRLSIQETDLTQAGAFRDVMYGCRYVIHCGVPFVSSQKDIVTVHLEAIRAIFDAIRSYGKSTVRRLVITGSASAVLNNACDPIPACGCFDETMWNEHATMQGDQFQLAKVMFEKEAWRLRNLIGIELTVILPAIAIGPTQTNEVSEAMRTLHDLASGSQRFPFAPEMYWNFVDVRDVAAAHVLALGNPKAVNQRYLISNCCMSLADIGKLIKKTHPHLHPPTKNAPWLLTMILGPISNTRVSLRYLWKNLGQRRLISNAKVKNDLLLEFRSIEETVADSIAELIGAGHLPAADSTASRAHREDGLIAPVLRTGVVALSFATCVFLAVKLGRRK